MREGGKRWGGGRGSRRVRACVRACVRVRAFVCVCVCVCGLGSAARRVWCFDFETYKKAHTHTHTIFLAHSFLSPSIFLRAACVTLSLTFSLAPFLSLAHCHSLAPLRPLARSHSLITFQDPPPPPPPGPGVWVWELSVPAPSVSRGLRRRGPRPPSVSIPTILVSFRPICEGGRHTTRVCVCVSAKEVEHGGRDRG